VSTIEELLEIKNSGSGLEIREYGRRDPSRWSHGTLYLEKLARTSPTSGCPLVGIVRSRTLATEFFVCYIFIKITVHNKMSDRNRYKLCLSR
jgi:hypothetical protein